MEKLTIKKSENTLFKRFMMLLVHAMVLTSVENPAFQAWIRQLESDYKAKKVRIWFKYKKFGWKNSPYCTRVDFDNGDEYIANGNKNTFMQGYLCPNLYIRPSCGKCAFKGIPRQGDITLADFWGIEKNMTMI